MENNDIEIILNTIHGSHAYGLNTSESDIDFKGIAIPKLPEYLYGIQTFEQKEYNKVSSPDMPSYINISNGVEGVVYDIRKFVKLALDCNPNIIEVLYSDDQFVFTNSDYGRMLRDNRHLFLSKKAKHSYGGFSYSQIKRIKNHKEWIDNPPLTQPQRQEYGLPSQPIFHKDNIDAILVLPSDILTNEYRVMAENEKEYNRALIRYNQYQIWMKTRNVKRKVLEDKSGFDSKFAMHAIRLQNTCAEILKEGTVHVLRPDREFLLDIRNGVYNYDYIIKYSDDKFLEIESLYESSSLQYTSNHKEANNILLTILEDFRRKL